MKFCYIDESGTGNDPFAVMVGVIVDFYRMKPTKEDWDSLLSMLSQISQKEIKEFHTKDFYRGRSPWGNLKGEHRSLVIDAIFEWYKKRSHHIVYSIIDKDLFENHSKSHSFYLDIGSLWRTMSFHIALSIQKNYQKLNNNKGNTLMIFDAHEKDQKHYTELLLSPPEWSEAYYSKAKNQKSLDQIIDVPHFVNSSHVGMIQLADCISYILRRYIEISENKVPPKYAGEDEKVSKWAETALKQSIPKASIYPKKSRCEAAEFFFQVAPPSIRS